MALEDQSLRPLQLHVTKWFVPVMALTLNIYMQTVVKKKKKRQGNLETTERESRIPFN